ncbi:MAG TPA: radical SAM protein [Thermoanaerobacter sp.]|nr:radical SAM protein [Thermoanaerobacter sp.]
MQRSNKLVEYIKKIYKLQNKERYYPDIFIKYLNTYYFDYNKIPNNPLYITWNITNKCNLNCFFCSADSECNSNIGHNELSDSDRKKIVEKIIKWGVLYVSIQGGEPTLCSDLIEIIERLVNNNIFTEIISNGTGIDEEFCKKIKFLNDSMYRIKISLDSCDEEINDRQRGKGSFKFATTALELFTIYNIPNVRVQSVLTNFNKHDLFNLYVFLHQFKVNSFGFSLVLPVGRALNLEAPKIDIEILEQVMKILEVQKKKRQIKVEKVHLGYLQNIKECEELFIENLDDTESNKIFKSKCDAGTTRLMIDPNGDVYPCDYLKFDEFKIGNILINNYNEIWFNKTLTKIRNITRFDKIGCKSCYRKNCNTGCMGLSYAKYNTIYAKDPNCKVEV